MKILVLPDTGFSYNSVRPEAEIYISLAEVGHDVTIMTTSNNAYAQDYQNSKVTFINLPFQKKFSWQLIKIIHHYIIEHKIDIVYATTSKTIPNAALACLSTKAKMIAYRGTTGGLYRSDIINYLAMLNPRINGVVCVSNAVTKHVQKKVRPAIKDKVKTIYKGHKLDWYNKPSINLTSIGSDSQYFNIFCIASNRPHKGFDYVLEAANKLTELTNIRLILVGKDATCEPLSSKIKTTALADKIICLGYREDVPEIAAACDLLILPSLREGLPRVILEALAVGTPVLTSANEGAMEIIEHNINGYIVPIANSQAIAQSIKYFHQHPDVLARLSQSAQTTIETKMSHQKTVENMLDFFSDILSSANLSYSTMK